MNDLLRPALYDAHHKVFPVPEKRSDRSLSHDLVGPICETGGLACETAGFFA